MSTEDESKQVLASAYQHVTNGGLSFAIERKDRTVMTAVADEPRHGLTLVIGTSNYGVTTEFRVPLTDSSMHALKCLLDEAQRTSYGVNEFSYVGSMATDVRIGNEALTFDRRGLVSRGPVEEAVEKE